MPLPDGGSPDAWLIHEYILGLESGVRQKVRSPRTIRTYRAGLHHLVAFLRARLLPPLGEAAREHLQAWVIAMRQELAPASASLYLTAARLFYAWLVEEGERADNPTDRVSAPAPAELLTDPFSAEEIAAILATQNAKTPLGARNIALFYVLLDTGLRREEAAQLKLADVNWKHGEVTVMGKGEKQRRVRLGSATQRALAAYLRIRSRDPRAVHPSLWYSVHGGALSASAIGELHRKLERRLGFSVHAHRWRHTFAQTFLDDSGDRESLRVLLGHESLETTKRYTKSGDARRALEAHRLHSPADRLTRRPRR